MMIKMTWQSDNYKGRWSEITEFYDYQLNKKNMNTLKGYSFWKGLGKGLIAVVLVAGPIVLNALPAEWMNITVGGLLVMALNAAKFAYKKI